MVFQDPYGSLDPRHTVRRIVGETLDASPARERGNHREAAIGQAIDAVGLRANDLDKYPHEFSGGQRQRIAIPRALVTRQPDWGRLTGLCTGRFGTGSGSKPDEGSAKGFWRHLYVN